MKLSYAHQIANRRPKDILSDLQNICPELDEIGGWTKVEVQDAVVYFVRWLHGNNIASIPVKIEVFRGESLSMVTASGDGFVIGWESKQ